ncbi:MAG: peptidylprolyl isomerase [Anaerolineales bacterium]|nr:peptidylprolyl isomerase [Anaerolineales bacterium]
MVKRFRWGLRPLRLSGIGVRLLRLVVLPVLVLGCAPKAVATEAPQPQPARLGPTSTPAPTAPTPTPPPPAPTLTAIPLPSSDDWRLGPDEADLSLLVYSDFQSPAGARLADVLADLRAIHPHDLQIVFRPYPLWPVHDKALIAAQAAESAGAQGLFWEMHDLLFSSADEWVALSPEDFRAWLEAASRSLPLDHQAFERAMSEGTFEDHALRDFAAALASGLPGAPVVFLNQTLVPMDPTLNNLEALLRLSQVEAQGLPPGPPPAARPEKAYLALLDTSAGPIEIELYPASAPQAVGSFVYLAQQGWYNGTVFHRVVPGALAESGDPTHTGLGGPAYRFGNEIDSSLSFSQVGMVSLRNDGPGSNGGIYFINLRPLPDLDGTYTIFGRVLTGLDLLQQLPGRDPIGDLLLTAPLVIESVSIQVLDA